VKIFKLKSNRNYLHGTDIYNYFIKNKFRNIKITFKKKIKKQPYIFNIFKEKITNKDLCILEYNYYKRKYLIGLRETKKKILSTYDYNENEFYKYFKLRKNGASCNFKSKFKSIEVLVALNKFYHNEKIRNTNWYFSKLKLNEPFDENRLKKFNIKIKKNIVNKFTIMNIYKNKKKIGEIDFINND
jgi:hypothetical protein